MERSCVLKKNVQVFRLGAKALQKNAMISAEDHGFIQNNVYNRGKEWS
jgi:hypothetical protein